MKNCILRIITLLFLSYLGTQAQTKNPKPRTIVTTDGEIDDVDSFIRMLLYSNEFRIEGLVYSSSMWHYKGDGKGTKIISEMPMTKSMYGEKTDLRWPGVTWMQELIDEYAKVYPKLILHAQGFPKPNYLKNIIKIGNIDFEGEMKIDTEGSEFIKQKLLDNSLEPIFLQVWGGTNTIARALKSIEIQYKNTALWQKIKAKVSKKAIIYAILDQDATYKNYIAPNWPNIKILYNSIQFACFAYPWKRQVPSEFQKYFEGKFMSEKIINNHGPLLKKYYSYGDGQKQEGDNEHTHGDILKLKNTQWGSFEQYDFISEGDSPAYLQLIDVGLNNLENPNYGGWGGRLEKSKSNPNRWEDGSEAADYNNFTQKKDNAYPQTRWLEAIQYDFASRADWCIKSFEEANHPPKVIVKNGNFRKVRAGQKLNINLNLSDIDEDLITVKFWQYKEAGNSKNNIEIEKKTNLEANIIVPKAAKKGDTFHIIAEGKDNGLPSLTRYQRIILEVI